MKKSKNNIYLVLIIFAAIVLISCSMGVKKNFLMTQTSFNDMVTSYYQYYETVSLEEQEYLKAVVNPKVIRALNILEKMNEAVQLEIDPLKIDQKEFQDLRFDLYRELPKIFKKEN